MSASRVPIDTRVGRLAERQHALVTRRQLRELGMTRSAVRQRLERGQFSHTAYEQVLAVAGAPRTATQQVMAACLAIDGALASHETAARLHGLDVPRTRITLTTPVRRVLPDVRMRVSSFLAPIDRTSVHGVPCTSVARTLIDLADACSDDRFEQLFGDALRKRLTNVVRVQSRAEALRADGYRGGALALRLAREYRFGRRHPLDSELERVFLRDVVGAHDLPDPVPQLVVRHGQRHVARVDFAYPDVRLAIQVDSWAYHFTREEWEADRTKDNGLAALGWLVLHVTSGDVRRRSAVAAQQILRAIGSRDGLR